MTLNQEQQNIINHLEGAILVSAPVGTGKTTVLTERLVNALKNGWPANQILSLTFTNRAAEEMKSRARQAVAGKEIFDELTISTFHGWCAYFLRAEAKELGLAADFSIFDEEEQLAVLKNVLRQFGDDFYLADDAPKNEYQQLLYGLYQFKLKNLLHSLGLGEAGPADQVKSRLGEAYARAVGEQNAVDFNDLVLLTLEALYTNEGLKQKWAQKYSFIQLDEFQDTHLSEYLIIKELAKAHKNIALIGDLDQTIYAWRGSRPFFIRDLFLKHFAPVTSFALTRNYRSQAKIINAAGKFLLSFKKAETQNLSSEQAPAGGRVEIFAAHNFAEEVDWAVKNIKDLRQAEPDKTIAVLARGHWLINEAAAIFKAQNLPHLTVDQYNFFRRQEIKDALAYLKLIANRFDLESASRVAARPPKDLGEATLNSIRRAGENSALKISDFFYLPNFSRPEPFSALLEEYKNGRLIVLDTETTGLNQAQDEIVQVYARELVKGQPGAELHLYLKNTVPVGASTAVHRLTDEFLAANGQEPKEALRQVKDFIGSAPVVGHNINFDLTMLASNGARQGIDLRIKNYYDTLDLAKRLVSAESYKLSSLAKLFKLSGATHSADEDVDATIELLHILVAKLTLHSAERQELFARYGKKFIRTASLLTGWQDLISRERPALAVAKILNESGLKDYYATQSDAEERLNNLESLVKFFGQRDESTRPPLEAWRNLVTLTALGKNLDFVALNQGQVPILTVHQVKGLEFDYVFVLGLNQGIFPGFRSSDQEEEKRLFYVALTRAKAGLFLSASNFDRFGRPSAQSEFLNYL